MKLTKTILAAALGLSLASLSHAQTIVYLTGSTAMRSTIYEVLTNAGTVFQSQPAFTGYGGSGTAASGSGDTYMAFSGTLVGGSGTVQVNCYWSGSEDGILHLASNNVVNQTFMDDSLITTSGNNDNAGLPATITDYQAQLAMADNAQSYSRTKTPLLSNNKEVGVITFEFVRNPGLWPGTNVTDSMVYQALLNGAKRAVFDGNAADTNDYVYVSGRDSGSGTRVNAFGNVGYGILTPPFQIEVNSANGEMTPLSFSTNFLGQVTTNYSGDFGFSSGGGLAATLGASTVGQKDLVNTNGTGGYSVIGYLGVSDASTAIKDGAILCSYNGVPFSTNNVYEGTYTFWGNEYVFEANNVGAGSTADNVYHLISTNTAAFCDGTKAVALTAMHCTRPGPTSPPTHN